MGEQLETGRMHPGQHERGNAGVDPWDRGGGEVLDEVRVSAREPIGPDVRICAGYVADVGEPLVAQQIVEDLNWRKASRAVLPIQEPHRGRLRRRLFRHRSADAESAAAPARPAAAIERPVVRKCRRSCMFASPLLCEKAAFARAVVALG